MLAPSPVFSLSAAIRLSPFASPQGEAVFIAEKEDFALESDGAGHDQVYTVFHSVRAGDLDLAAYHHIHIEEPSR